MKAKIYPVKLATVVQCDYSHNVLNTRFGEKIDTAISSYIIVDGSDIIVFDTGHRILHYDNGQELNLRGNAAENFKKRFDELNLRMEDVTHVVLSHLHWDHIGNCDLFPNAKIYIQRKRWHLLLRPFIPFIMNGNTLWSFWMILVISWYSWMGKTGMSRLPRM